MLSILLASCASDEYTRLYFTAEKPDSWSWDDIGALEHLGDQGCGAVLLPGDLGVAVHLATPADEVVPPPLDRGADPLHQVVQGRGRAEFGGG